MGVGELHPDLLFHREECFRFIDTYGYEDVKIDTLRGCIERM